MHKLQLITRAPPHRSPRQEDADELIIPILDPHSRPVGSPVAPTEQPLAPGGAPQIRVVLRRTPGRGEELRVKLLTFLAGPQCYQTQIGIVLILARPRGDGASEDAIQGVGQQTRVVSPLPPSRSPDGPSALLAVVVAGLSWLGHSGPLGRTEGDRHRVAGSELHFVAAHRDGDVVAVS